MRKSFFLLCLLTTIFFSFTIINKSNELNTEGIWKFIADKKVSWGVDHDVIYTGNVNDDFRQLKLKVTDGPLKMYDMKVYFDNGEEQDVSIRFQIRQGGESRVIDLNGGLRHLSKIEFWYETKGFMKGRARIAVWGKK
jgi:hypothetical protein